MAQITFENKVKIDDDPSLPAVNKVRDVDMNEIKDVINENEASLNTAVTDLTNLSTYSTIEAKIGTWLGKPIYRKVVQYTKSSTGEENLNLGGYSITNVDNIWLNHNSFIKTTNNEYKPINNYESSNYITFCNFPSSTQFRLYSNSNYANGTWNLIFEYTKTTD